MKIHEYQAKEILRQAGVAVPRGIVARSADEAKTAFGQLGGKLAVVKAQIHAGGRGKGTVSDNARQRGVQLVRSADEAAAVAGALLGKALVTIQTGPAGQTVRQVLVEEGCDIARELYLGIVVDRASSGPVLMVSSEGGMNIEDVAAKTPELIFKESFSPDAGLQSYQVRKLSKKLGLAAASAKSADKFMKSLCRLFVANDCSLTEINPLVVTGAGELLALDAKMTFDDNALMRHPDLATLRDVAEEEPAEVRAGQAGLSYVKLEGGQLPGCGRRGQCRASHRGLPHLAGRQERQGRAGQYLWRHHALHDDRQRHLGSLQGGGLQRPPGCPPGRDRSRARPQDPGRQRPEDHHRRGTDRRRQEGRGGGHRRRVECANRLACWRNGQHEHEHSRRHPSGNTVQGAS
jgi:succinyl-CoA synthetase beta subunit